MKTKHYLLLLSLVISLNSFAQIGKLIKKKKDDIVDKTDEVLSGDTDLEDVVNDAVEDKLNNLIDNARNDYDTTSFNFAIALSDNAGLFEDQERFEKHKDLAFMLLDRANVAEEVTPIEDAQDNNKIGEMGLAGNKFRMAENRFRKAIEIYETNALTDNLLYPKSLSNLALLYHTTGRLNEAELVTLRALELRENVAGSNHSSYGASKNNLAMVYKDLGKYTEAEKLMNEALEVVSATMGTQGSAYAICLNNKAIILQMLGRFSEAETLLKQALEVAGEEMREKSTNYQRMLVNLALLYQEMERYEEAEAIYLDAIARKEKQWKKNHPDYAHMLNNLAALYIRMGKTDQVGSLLLEAKDIYEKKFGVTHPAYATTINNLANFYRTQQRFADAEPLLLQAIEIRQNTLGEKHPKLAESQEDLAILYWKMGKIDQARDLYLTVTQKADEFVKAYFPAMSEAEKEKYWSQLRPIYLRFYNFAVENPQPVLLTEMYNNHLLTKAILLSATNRIKEQILSSGDESLIQDYLKWIDLKEEIAQLYTFSKEQLIEQEINLDALEAEANSLERSLSERSALFTEGYEDETANITLSDIQSSLNSEEAIVDLVEFPKFESEGEMLYVAFVITAESYEPKIVKFDNGNDLDTKFFQLYRNMIRSKRPDKISYQNYWQSIDAELAGKTKIYTSLDGVYNQINLNTLMKEDGSYLVEDKTFILLTNMRDLLSENPSPASNDAILVGFPNYGSAGSITPLPGTKAEVEAIAPILQEAGYNVSVFTADEATESNIKNISSPKILHIATHGFFIPDVEEGETEKVFGIEPEKAKENPMLRSGLMLAGAENAQEGLSVAEVDGSDNGVLNAFEIANLDLKGTLVAASACETGLGDVKEGEGVYGLQRAFQVAGADAILMSLWKVSDDATQKLMTTYKQNLVNGQDKVEAFKAAQLALKTEYPEPYYWGAFVMVGK